MLLKDKKTASSEKSTWHFLFCLITQKFLNRWNTRLFFTVRKSCHNIELITNSSIIERDRGTTDTNFWMFADIDDEKIIFDIVFFFSFFCSWYGKETEKLNFILKFASQQFQIERRNVFQLRRYSWDTREILWIFLNSWRTLFAPDFPKKKKRKFPRFMEATVVYCRGKEITCKVVKM